MSIESELKTFLKAAEKRQENIVGNVLAFDDVKYLTSNYSNGPLLDTPPKYKHPAKLPALGAFRR